MQGNHRALRKGRYSDVGRIYHIIFRTSGKDLLLTERQIICRKFMEPKLLKANTVLASVVMPDHVHILFELNESEPIGRFLARLKSQTPAAVNRQRKSKNSVWSRGYYDRAIRKEDDLKTVARYIVMNPVRAGLASAVREYPYWNAVWL
jgi:REP element-mobilizing transposase RayT